MVIAKRDPASSTRHLLERLRVRHYPTQCVRDSDCWFGAWHETMHSNLQHAQPKQWNTTVSVDQIVANTVFQQVTRAHRGPAAARSAPRAPSLLWRQASAQQYGPRPGERVCRRGKKVHVSRPSYLHTTAQHDMQERCSSARRLGIQQPAADGSAK